MLGCTSLVAMWRQGRGSTGTFSLLRSGRGRAQLLTFSPHLSRFAGFTLPYPLADCLSWLPGAAGERLAVLTLALPPLDLGAEP